MEARRLHRRCGVRASEHLRLEVIAAHCGATIDVARIDGALAQLVRRGRKVQILLADHVTDLAAQRFSIAHELGHLVLGHPTPQAVTAAKGAPVPAQERDHEEEANAFAAELLMPAAWLRTLTRGELVARLQAALTSPDLQLAYRNVGELTDDDLRLTLTTLERDAEAPESKP